ncbi:MAG: nuclease A inhibitor family protein [Armatimonas sp.]
MTAAQTALRKAARGLLFVSESDSRLQVVKLTDVQFAELKLTGGFPVSEALSPMTTAQDWYGPEEKETRARFQALETVLGSALTDAMAYRSGDGPNITLWILGKDAEGGYTGLRTRLTET